jgi:hypothetical protein
VDHASNVAACWRLQGLLLARRGVSEVHLSLSFFLSFSPSLPLSTYTILTQSNILAPQNTILRY